MTKLLQVSLFLLMNLFQSSFADTLSIKDSAKIVVPLGLTPLYESPVSGGFPVSYLEPADTCHIDSARFDTSDVEWVFVKSRSRSGWLQKSSVRPASLSPDGQWTSGAKASRFDADTKRRYRIIAQHPEWERRIIKAVREGKICLDMNDAQVLASWGEPIQKSVTFILGAGKQDFWLYKNPNGKIETIFIVKGRVVGWSE